MTKKISFREWRRKEGLSVEEFARAVGISFSSCSKWDVFPDRKPRGFHARAIRRKYPNCPLAE